jgi:hypothetical protein
MYETEQFVNNLSTTLIAQPSQASQQTSGLRGGVSY